MCLTLLPFSLVNFFQGKLLLSPKNLTDFYFFIIRLRACLNFI